MDEAVILGKDNQNLAEIKVQENLMNKILKLINTRRSLFLVALVASFLMLNFYLVLPKLDQKNICWTTMSVLDDDQLYENAMKSYIAKFIEYRDVTRPRKGLFRSDDWGGSYCMVWGKA